MPRAEARCLDGIGADAGTDENLRSDALGFGVQGEQEVFCADVRVAQRARLLRRGIEACAGPGW